MFHARSSFWLSQLSAAVFGALPSPADRNYIFRGGCHVLDTEPEAAFERLADLSPETLQHLLADLPQLAGELVDTMCRRETHLLNAVREGVWILGFGDEIMADCRLSSPHRDFVVASPSYAIVSNLDRAPLRARILRFAGSHETDRGLDLADAENISLRPGQTMVINGFREVVVWEDAGILLGVITSLPRGAYDAVFSLTDGSRLGLLASELRTSSLALALRAFAAVGWRGAEVLSAKAACSALRELRWAAMNYDWRADVPGLKERLTAFASDSDTDLRRLANQCLSLLLKKGAATQEGAA